MRMVNIVTTCRRVLIRKLTCRSKSFLDSAITMMLNLTIALSSLIMLMALVYQLWESLFTVSGLDTPEKKGGIRVLINPAFPVATTHLAGQIHILRRVSLVR